MIIKTRKRIWIKSCKRMKLRRKEIIDRKLFKEENEHDVIEEMEDRCCGSPGL